MFGALTDKMQGIFSGLAGKKKLKEENIAEAVSEVRLALLEADVNYGVTKTFVKKVKKAALGDEVIKSVSPGQQFIKVVHDELAALMGEGEPTLQLKGAPAVLMLCGLQGAGKTTQGVKLAKLLKKEGRAKKPLIIACDLQRPAAIEQLKALGKQGEIDVFSLKGETSPLTVAKQGLKTAQAEGYDLVIADTAGRLHIDDELMKQLKEMKRALSPDEVLFVANAATGQDAVTTAKEFNEQIGITGTVLTMLDGNTRAGAAISIKEVTGQPLKFEGVGEKLDDIQLFNPNSMADRILGMGDTINLVKKAQEHIDESDAKKMEEKLRNATFSYEDYLGQVQMVKKMGSLKGLLGMFPGMSKIKEMDINEKEFFKVEAIIQSMTPKERQGLCELVQSRKKRISAGSGTSLDEVNKLIKTFKKAKLFFKNMPNMKKMQKMFGGV